MKSTLATFILNRIADEGCIMLSNINTIFATDRCRATGDFLDCIPYINNSDDLFFGFKKHGEFIFPRPGNGLSKYSLSPIELIGIEGEYILGFDGLFGAEHRKTTDINVALTWKTATLIIGIPIPFGETGQKIHRIDSAYFRF
jgi:hypothetical protein